MKIILGEKLEGIDYQIRKGVYAIVFNSTKDKVMAVQNGRGDHFLPGGGIENNENHLQCLKREMLEETGYDVAIGSFIGNARRYFKSSKGEPLISEGFFYIADLLVKMQEPIEVDHDIKWIDIEDSRHILIHEHHFWAVKEGLTTP